MVSRGRTLRLAAIVPLLPGLALLAPAAQAQQEAPDDPAVIHGTVRDAAGEPVAGAAVAVRGEHAPFPRRQRTAEDGSFRFEVPPGRYTLSAAFEGFRGAVTTVDAGAPGAHEVELSLVRIYALERLVVTATRGEREIGHVPQAVSVVGREDVQRAQKSIDIEEALRRVPGVRVESELGTTGRTRIIVRGTGTRANNPAGSGVRGVRVLVDGIPKNNAGGSAQDLINIDLRSVGRIEVLRGPSSALYGNQSGGVVNLITEEPPPEPFFEYRQLVGAYGLLGEHVKLGGRSDRLDYLVSGYRTDQSGFREHSRFESTGLHSKLGFVADERTRLTAVVSYGRHWEQSPGPLTRELFEEDPTQADPVFAENDVQATLDELRFGLTVRREGVFGERDAAELTGYYIPRHLGPFLQIGVRIPQDFQNRGANLRYTNEGPLGELANVFTVGADFQNTPIVTGVFAREGGAAFAMLEENATTFGVYALEELTVSDGVVLSAGARYDHIRFFSRDLAREGVPEASRTYDQLTPKLGVTWFPVPDLSLYATFGRGFETPIIGELRVLPGGEFGFNQALDPQKTTNVEVGGRGEVAGRLTFEAAVFRQVVDDLISPVGTFPQNSFENLGEVDQLGVELAGQARLATGLSLYGAYTFADFTIEEFQTDQADFSGNALPGVPDHTLFGELEWRHRSGFAASVDLQHVSSLWFDNANTAENDPYTVLNARLSHEWDAGQARLSPFLGVNNLTDTRYSAFALINDTNRRFYNPLPGIHAYGGLAVTF